MATICIIEDDEGLRCTLVDLFEAHGFEVIVRDNGKDLEKLLVTYAFDALILDLLLKEDDGFRVLSTIRKKTEYAALPVIILTADVTYERKMEGLSNGATDYIQKPFSLNELLLKINNFIHLKNSTVAQTVDGLLTQTHNIIRKKDSFLRTVDAYLLKNIQEPIDIDELAWHCNMSRSSLDKVMRKTAHTTAALYIRKYKVNCAIRFLEQDHGSIKEIAYLCGFQSLSYFSTSFKLVTGKSPTAYKKTT
jgi:DNA-binding response OmpR family regulator